MCHSVCKLFIQATVILTEHTYTVSYRVCSVCEPLNDILLSIRSIRSLTQDNTKNANLRTQPHYLSTFLLKGVTE